jgi:hypothetical protein
MTRRVLAPAISDNSELCSKTSSLIKLFLGYIIRPSNIRSNMDAAPYQSHTPDGSARKRRRPARSCVQCRVRKVKCDLEEPCSACVRTRRGDQCSYAGDIPLADHSSYSIPRDDGAAGTLFAAIGELESAGPSVPHVRTSEPVPRAGNRNGTTPRLSEAAVRVSLPVSVAPTELHATAASKVDHGHEPEQVGAGPKLSSAPLEPQLRTGPTKDKFFGPTHWMQTAQQV